MKGFLVFILLNSVPKVSRSKQILNKRRLNDKQLTSTKLNIPKTMKNEIINAIKRIYSYVQRLQICVLQVYISDNNIIQLFA